MGHPLSCSASCRQKFMAIECPLSCGICTHTCNDTDPSCGAWATAGECEENPDSMLRLCPTSCGLCTPECKDADKECPGWGAAGECNESECLLPQKARAECTEGPPGSRKNRELSPCCAPLSPQTPSS